MASAVLSANQVLISSSQDEIDHTPTKGTFPSSLWGDIFISNDFDSEVQVKYDESFAVILEEVRSMVGAKESKITDKIVLIDDIERLGLSYHFAKEVEEQLEQIYHKSSDSDFKAMKNYDLFNTALLFRLFRQHGYDIPCGVFDKFKDKNNKFLTSLERDVKGLLSFYEATDVKFRGEHVLEEAVIFATYHLNRLRSQMDSSLKDKVSRALEQSIHRGVAILETRYYIPIYQNQNSNNKQLAELAKLNFNFLQSLYQKELSDLSRWWKDLKIGSKIPYMRDRVVEGYFWGVAMNYEPQYSFARSAVVKAMLLGTMSDDTYDTYAPLEDLEILTQVLQSDDIDEVDKSVPAYIKEIYNFRTRLFEEFEAEVSKRGRSFTVFYLKEAVKQLSMAYNTDANWYRRKIFASFEDVVSNSIVSSALFVLCCASLLSGSATKQDFEWLMSKPPIAAASALLGRYVNDIASYERERKINGESLTAVDCYMKQYCATKEEAMEKFAELAEDSWMVVNKEWVEISSVPRHILTPVLSYCRAAMTTYKKGKDGFTYPEKALKPHILALLVDPIIST